MNHKAAILAAAITVPVAAFGLLMTAAGAVIVSAAGGTSISGVGAMAPSVGRAIGGVGPLPALGHLVVTRNVRSFPPRVVLPGVPAGGYANGFDPTQCTAWAADNHPGVTWGGDAWTWIAHARRLGTQTAATPSPGAIVVYAPGNGYGVTTGHVAIVVDVRPGQYTVSEDNYIAEGTGTIDERTVAWPDAHVEGFIP